VVEVDTAGFAAFAIAMSVPNPLRGSGAVRGPSVNAAAHGLHSAPEPVPVSESDRVKTELDTSQRSHAQGGMWNRRRKLAIAAGIVVAILLVARVAIDPLATRFTQQGLDSMTGYEGRFDDMSFSLIALNYEISGLRIRRSEATDGGAVGEEILHADAIQARILWRNLVRGHVLGTGRVVGARLALPIRVAKQVETPTEAPKPREIDDTIQSLIPIRLERLELRDCSVVLVDERYARRPELRFDHIEAAAENFTTRRALDEGRPMTLALRCTMQHSGDLSLFVSIEPLAQRLSFAGEAKLSGLNLDDMREVFAAATNDGLVPRGTFEVFASFRCDEGKLKGGVKPLLANPDMEAVGDDLLVQFEAAFADAGLALFSDRVPGREATAAIVPIEGDLSNLDVKAWPAIFSIFRNAFVEGLSASFRGLPPDEPAQAGQENP
jgi:hypothetical protein